MPIPGYYNAFSGQTYRAGQGIVSLEFDDGVTGDYATIYPLLAARGLTAAFAVMNSFIGQSGYLTLAQILAMQAAGHEFICHTDTHGTDPVSYEAFKYETLAAAATMWKNGIHATSFAQPGSWSAAYYIDDPAGADVVADSFLRRFFASYMAYDASQYAPGNYWFNLPRTQRNAVPHTAGYALTLAELEALVDACAASGKGCHLLYHTNNLGTAGNISLADLTTFLTYLQTKVSAGLITVMTPTQQLFAREIS